MEGAQQMSDVLPDNYGRGATREPAHCPGATSTSGLPQFRLLPAQRIIQKR